MKQLIQDILNTNDQAKWAQLIDTTHKDLLAQAHRLISQGDLHLDALQESFISIYKNLPKFYQKNKKFDDYEFTINFSKWSRTIVRNQSFNLLRKRKNQNKLTDSQNNLDKLNEQIQENKKDSFELREYLNQMLSCLKQKEHKLLALKYFDGMSNLEISTETGYQINSIPVLINRALGQLRKRFEHAGLVIAAATLTEVLTQQSVTTSVTTTIPPEVFHSIKSIPSEIGITTTTLKGLLMKSLLILISATVLSISAFYLPSKADAKTPAKNLQKSLKTSQESQTNDSRINQTNATNNSVQEATLEETNNSQTTTSDGKLYGILNPTIQHTLPNIKQFKHYFKTTAYGKIWNDKEINKQLKAVTWSAITPELLAIVQVDPTFCMETEFQFIKELLSIADEVHLEANKKEFLTRLIIKDRIKSKADLLKKALEKVKSDYTLKHLEIKTATNDSVKSSENATVTSIYQTKINSIDKIKFKIVGQRLYMYKGTLHEIDKEINKFESNVIFEGKLQPSVMINLGTKKDMRHPFMYTKKSKLIFKASFKDNQFHERSISSNIDKTCLFKPFQKTITEEGFTPQEKKYMYMAINLDIEAFTNWAMPVIKESKMIPDSMSQMIISQIKDSISGEIFMSFNKSGFITHIKVNSVEKAQAIIATYSAFISPYGIKMTKGPNSWINIITSDGSYFTNEEYDLNIKGVLATANCNNKSIINSATKFLYAVAVKYQHQKDYKEMVKPCLPILTKKLYTKYFGKTTMTIKKEGDQLIVDQRTDIPFITLGSFFSYFHAASQRKTTTKESKNDGEIIITQGKFIQKRDFDMGKRQGLWTISDYNGKPFLETNYDQNYKDGVRKLYFYNGKTSHSIEYKKGHKHGSYKRYFLSGKLKEEGQFKNNGKIGLWKYYHASGNIRSQGLFLEDHKKGAWDHFDSNNNKTMSPTYSTDSNIPMQSIIYHPNGSPKISIELNNQIHTIKQYNQKATLIRITHFFNGAKVGHWKEFNNDSKLINEWEYNMEFMGTRKSYDSKGNIKSIINYEKNMIEGKQLFFHSNGAIKSQVRFSLNSPVPPWKSYSEDNQLIGEWKKDGNFSGNINKEFVAKIIAEFNIFTTPEEQTLNLTITGDVSIGSINLITTIKLFRGQTIKEIETNYGHLLSLQNLKESLLYQEYHLNNPTMEEFINDTMNGEKNYFLMNEKILLKFSAKDHKVFEQDYLELKKHLLE